MRFTVRHVAAVFIVCPILSVQPSWGQEVIEGIVAIVGDKYILKTEWMQTAQGYALQMGIDPRAQEAAFNRIKINVLNDMINEKVMLIKADEDTIKLTTALSLVFSK